MTKFIHVRESNYKQVKETLVNINRIAYIQESHETSDNNAVIGINDDVIYTVETLEEIEEKIMAAIN